MTKQQADYQREYRRTHGLSERVKARAMGKAQADNSPTLDRIIPERGYVKGNVVVISALANRIKTNANVRQIELVAEWLRKQ